MKSRNKILSLLSVALVSSFVSPAAFAQIQRNIGTGMLSTAVSSDSKSDAVERLEKRQADIEERIALLEGGELDADEFHTDRGSAHFKCVAACKGASDQKIISENIGQEFDQIDPLCHSIFEGNLLASVSPTCQTAVKQFGPAKAKAEISRLKTELKSLTAKIERAKKDSEKVGLQRSEKQRMDLARYAICPYCDNLFREPTAGETAIGIISALTPIGMGAMNLGMYGMGLNAYNNNYSQYMNNQMQIGAPVQAPGFWGGSAWGAGVPWGTGGIGIGGGGMNPLASLLGGGMGLNLSLGLGGNGGFNPMFGMNGMGMNPMFGMNGMGMNPMFGMNGMGMNPMFGMNGMGNGLGGGLGLGINLGMNGMNGMGMNPMFGMNGMNGMGMNPMFGMNGMGMNPMFGMNGMGNGLNGGLGFGLNINGGLGGLNGLGGLGGINGLGGLGGINGGLGGLGGLNGLGGLGGMNSSIYLQQQQQQAALMAQYQAQQQAMMQEQMLKLQKQQEAQKSIMLAQQQYAEALSRLQQTMQGAASIQATGGLIIN